MTAWPSSLTIRPDSNLRVDPLSEVLRSVRLTGGVFLNAHFTAPWCVTANMDASDCTPFLAKPAQLIAFHVVTEGELLVWIGDEKPLTARAGEILLFPGNDGHVLASAQGVKAVRAGTLIQPAVNGGLARIDHGGGGASTRIICGFLATEDGCNPLIAALPPVLSLDIREGTARDWIEASVRFAASELAAGRLASSNVLSRLSETLLVEAVRQYSSTLANADSGWLNGVKDPQIGRALALIHRDMAAPWSAETLARNVALSRSAFADRFTALVGMPPIRYLTVCRLQTARLNLRQIRTTIAKVAHGVGYESEEAFSRAFKREFGVSPAQWRDARDAA
ncbi:MAG: AraC family transcriptional regulator [Pseudorhodoplanes sp.]|nr:AraC family transcriptional regulator [Pseudorhodoplanes sp.]